MPNNLENTANAVSEAIKCLKRRQYEQALAICDRILEVDPNVYDAYAIRWGALKETIDPDKADAKIKVELEAFLKAHIEETPEVLETAYRGYKYIGNIPESLFERLLQCPGTRAAFSALIDLEKRSNVDNEKWSILKRIIDEFTISNSLILSWYVEAHEKMLILAEQNRLLTSDVYLDELIERYLQAKLAYHRNSQQICQGAYLRAVQWRLKFSINLDKALETLEEAEERLKDKEEQELLVNPYYSSISKSSVEEAQKDITRLRGEIYLKQERWKEAYDALKVTTTLYPDYLTSLSMRFSEYRINRFFLLGRALEGLGEFEQAVRYYTDAHFAPYPHPQALAGLERIYQTRHGSLEGFDDFLKAAEAEYRVREVSEREIIRQNLIKENINKEATDFTLKTLEGKTFALSAMRGKVILLDVWASWCGPCIRAASEIQKVYEHFRPVDDVIIWGVNDGEHPEKVRAFVEKHQPPWPILLDRNQEVRRTYNVQGIPKFLLIDKAGRWQYAPSGYSEWKGQELIWLIESLQQESRWVNG